jgi:serine/threonine-protein kinase
MTVAEARDRFRDRGLVIIEDGAREVAEAAPGTIVQQRPAPGAALTDLELRVIVAVAPPGILVPDVVGLPLAQAQARLEKEGLTVAEPGSEASSQPPGSILKQIPAAGTRTAGGTQVYLVQSQAPAIAVPKVTGRSLRAAKDAITKAGLTVGSTRYEEDAELGGGTVLRQSPAPGEEVPSGTAVDLVAVSPN